jgi:hypothetical protein
MACRAFLRSGAQPLCNQRAANAVRVVLVWMARFELAASRFQGEPSTGLTIHPEIVGRGREVFMMVGSISAKSESV